MRSSPRVPAVDARKPHRAPRGERRPPRRFARGGRFGQSRRGVSAGLRLRRHSSLLLTRTLEGLTVLLVILDVVAKSGYPHLRQEKLKRGAGLARDRSSLAD